MYRLTFITIAILCMIIPNKSFGSNNGHSLGIYQYTRYQAVIMSKYQYAAVHVDLQHRYQVEHKELLPSRSWIVDLKDYPSRATISSSLPQSSYSARFNYLKQRRELAQTQAIEARRSFNNCLRAAGFVLDLDSDTYWEEAAAILIYAFACNPHLKNARSKDNYADRVNAEMYKLNQIYAASNGEMNEFSPMWEDRNLPTAKGKLVLPRFTLGAELGAIISPSHAHIITDENWVFGVRSDFRLARELRWASSRAFSGVYLGSSYQWAEGKVLNSDREVFNYRLGRLDVSSVIRTLSYPHFLFDVGVGATIFQKTNFLGSSQDWDARPVFENGLVAGTDSLYGITRIGFLPSGSRGGAFKHKQGMMYLLEARLFPEEPLFVTQTAAERSPLITPALSIQASYVW